MSSKSADIKRVSLNLFLLKDKGRKPNKAPWTEEEFLAKPVVDGKPQRISVDRYLLKGEAAGTLYVRKPYSENKPEWISFLERDLQNSQGLRELVNRSYSAILLIEAGKRQFVIAFGHGRHMLDMATVEFRFGLKVALNSIAPDKIASIDKQTFDSSPRISRTQAIRAASVTSYDVDPEQDMLRAIVGLTSPPHIEKLGEVVAGMDSLKISVPIRPRDLNRTLEYALSRFKSKDYLKEKDGRESDFAWVDNIEPIADATLISELDQQLWDSLKSSELSSTWMAVPEIIDWEDIAGFSYKPLSPDQDWELDQVLQIEKFAQSFRKNATLQTLKNKSVYMVSTSGHVRSYQAYRAIYSEMKNSVGTFVLNAGSWFKIHQGVEQRVNRFFESLRGSTTTPDPPFIEYDHKDEEDYNKAVVAQNMGHVCLDRKLINFGGGASKIEVCDIYLPRKPGNRSQLFHVKRGRSSSSLSHLFAQGLVSCELLIDEPKFVVEVDKQLQGANVDALNGVIKGSDYNVVYVIIDGPKGSPLDIPFFSKVTLEGCAKRLQRYGFSVNLMHVGESSSVLDKKKAKRKAAREAKKGVTVKLATVKKAAVRKPAKRSTTKKAAIKKAATKKIAAKKAKKASAKRT